MKDALLGLLVAGHTGLLLLGSCGLMGNGEEEKTKADSTYFQATLNGEETWSGRPDASFSDQGRVDWLVVFGDSVYEGQSYKEGLGFSLPYEGSKAYSAVNREVEIEKNRTRMAGVSFSVKDWDVILSRYHATDDSSSNQLMITEYDTTSGIMEGTFRTTVVVDSADREPEPGEPPRLRPDTLRFTDGEFRVKVRDLRDR